MSRTASERPGPPLDPAAASFDPAVAADELIRLALAEDLGERGDITSNAVLSERAEARSSLVAREAGVLAGITIAREIVRRVDAEIRFRSDAVDGLPLLPGQVLARIEGPARGILAAERTVLNFLQRLSGIASLTALFVEAIRGTGTALLDTRKTTPGWRALEKYAVLVGGGRNHRRGLYDMILIKDNHEQAAGGVGEAVRRALRNRPAGVAIEVEVKSDAELDEALAFPVDGILLDNMTPDRLARAVARIDLATPRPWVEVSGGITLETARSFAIPGVDFLSAGALTHSAKALDLALDFEPIGPGER